MVLRFYWSQHTQREKIPRYNTACISQITIDGEALEDVKTFTYLDSIVDEHGGSGVDVKVRIGKSREAYLQMKNIWNRKQLPTNTKVRIFNTNVKTVLLYGGGNLQNYESHHPEDTSVYQ
ncbi:unnamed protein product [Schistosoma curassoni]|uniref:DUF6451 domain-containing protein n=1 Tax=Schistosoma curassoni TaxID=6186 RepID=A0A183JYG5_9TREM|nr:unnamed protein product [Schistosoma curassoni]